MPIPATFTPQAISDRVDRICNDAGLDPNLGLFPLGSPLRLVGRHITLEYLGGFRALMHQISNPVIAQGVLDHSHFVVQPFVRMAATQAFLTGCNYADRDGVKLALRRYALGHDRVHGVISAGACPDRVGEPYDAWQDEDRAWVHATVIEAMIEAYDVISGTPHTLAEKDAIWQDGRILADAMDLDVSTYAPHYAELRSWMDTRVAATTYDLAASDPARPNLHIHRAAKSIARALFNLLPDLNLPESVAHETTPSQLWPLIPFAPPALAKVEFEAFVLLARAVMHSPARYRPEWHDYVARTGDPS